MERQKNVYFDVEPIFVASIALFLYKIVIKLIRVDQSIWEESMIDSIKTR